jgi:hypothetical protein
VSVRGPRTAHIGGAEGGGCISGMRLSKQWVQVPDICACFVLVNPLLLFDLSTDDLFVQLLGRRDRPSRHLLSLHLKETEIRLNSKAICKHCNVYVILRPLKTPFRRTRIPQRTRLLPSCESISRIGLLRFCELRLTA